MLPIAREAPPVGDQDGRIAAGEMRGLTSWRAAARRAERDALERSKRGPKAAKDERDTRIALLEREKAALEEKFRTVAVDVAPHSVTVVTPEPPGKRSPGGAS